MTPGLCPGVVEEAANSRRYLPARVLPLSHLDISSWVQAAMALTAAQRGTIVREAEEMRAELVAMFDRQRVVFARLGTLLPSGPMDAPDSSMVRLRAELIYETHGLALLKSVLYHRRRSQQNRFRCGHMRLLGGRRRSTARLWPACLAHHPTLSDSLPAREQHRRTARHVVQVCTQASRG